MPRHQPHASTAFLRARTLVDVVDDAAARAPQLLVHFDRPLDAFPDAGATISYRELAQYGQRLAAGLHAAGVRRSQRVAIVKRNHFDIYLLVYAAMRLGAVPAPVSPELTPAAAGELLGIFGPDHLVTDRTTVTTKALRGLPLSELAPSVLSVGDGVAGGTPIDVSAPSVPAAVVREMDTPVLVTHTSGTTDTPKLAVQSNRTLAANWSAIPLWAKLLSLRETVGAHLSVPHIRAITGITSLMAMRWGLVAVTDPTPSHVDAIFSEYRPGVIETFPNVFILWERLLNSSSRPLASARLFFNTFDAMHPRTMQALLDGSGRRNALYIQQYGQTETGPITTRFYTRRSARRADGRCVGHPVPGLSRFRIIEPPGNRGGQARGEIVVKSKSLVVGYLGREAQYANNFRDGWWRMTDLGWRSRWGCLHLHDREVDRSETVTSLLAVEDQLLQRLQGLLECVLVTLEDGTITPIISMEDDAALDVRAWERAARDSPALNPPRQFPWQDIPRTATWKVRRVELRRILEDETPPPTAVAVAGAGQPS